MIIRPLLIAAAVAAPLGLCACETMATQADTASASTVSRDSSGAPGPITQTNSDTGTNTSPGPKNPG